jgi:hypothetical protein
VALFLEPGFDALLIGDAQGNQFLIAVHQMGYTAQGNTDPARHEGLMHFGHAAVFPKPPLANQSNDLQAKFAVRQGPAPFFFGTLAAMVVGAGRLDAPTRCATSG